MGGITGGEHRCDKHTDRRTTANEKPACCALPNNNSDLLIIKLPSVPERSADLFHCHLNFALFFSKIAFRSILISRFKEKIKITIIIIIIILYDRVILYVALSECQKQFAMP